MGYVGRSIQELYDIITAELKESEALLAFSTPANDRVPGGSGAWPSFVRAIGDAQTDLGIQSVALGRDWQDDAGDAFMRRQGLAQLSMDPWIEAPMPLAQIDALPRSIIATHQEVSQLKALIEQAEQQLANPLSEVNVNGGSLGAMMIVEQWKRQAGEALDLLAAQFTEVTSAVLGAIPTTPWNGPLGSDGSAVPPDSTSPTAAGPVPRAAMPGTDPGLLDPTAPPTSVTPSTDTPGGPASDPAGGPTGGPSGGPTSDPAGGPAGDPAGPPGPGLAGLPTVPPPTLPALPAGPGGVGTLPTTPALPPMMPVVPPARPIPPLPTGVPVPSKAGPGTGAIPLGGGIGGGLGGLKGIGGGLDPRGIGTGQEGGPTGPAQAAREMPTRQAVSSPQAPIVAPTTAATTASAAGAGSSTPPPMMPPLGAGGGGNGQPRPGTADRSRQSKARPANRLPGVPPKLRGRSGKLDPTAGFGSMAAPTSDRRRRMDEDIQTVQLLDEELWEVKDQAAAPVPATQPGRGRRSST